VWSWPSVAADYQHRQAIQNVADGTGMSFRKSASELHEVLPEVCDHLAPNADVLNSPGCKPEKDERGKDRTPLTMKQQVRLIQKNERPKREHHRITGASGGSDWRTGRQALITYFIGRNNLHSADDRRAEPE
jgi:hypothetical protein